MLEYVFFHQQPMRQFCEFLQKQGLEPQILQADESLLIGLEEEAVSDALSDRIDDYYDDMMDLDQVLFNESVEPGSDDYQAAGVVVNLADGKTVYADVPGTIQKRVMEVLAPRELGDFVNAIIDAVENPDERPLCKRS